MRNRLLARPWTAQLAVIVAVAAAPLSSGCEAPAPDPAPKNEAFVWKNLGHWSGRGNAQTESFIGLTGSLRMQWKTKNDMHNGGGRFRLILQSAISGRTLQEPVDVEGPGEGTAYVAEDPRGFYISIESEHLEWSFTVDEAVFGTAVEGTGQPD